MARGLDVRGSAAGADKMAASFGAAFDKIQADMDKLQASMAKMGDLGKIGDAGAASLGKLDDSLKGAAAQADALTASVGKADDTLKGLGGSADASAAGLGRASDAAKGLTETSAKLRDTTTATADGVKGVGAGADASAVQMAEFNKVMRDSAAVQAEHAAVMADSNAKIALGQRVNTAAYRDASVEAAAAQKAQSAAAKQAAADAEAGAKKHEMAVLGIAAAYAYGIDQAAKLQTQVTRLYTSAGESQGNLGMIQAGILGMAGPTATDQTQLAKGAYWVESAGFHGKDALTVL